MKFRKILLSFTAVFLVGCVPSLHRLYSDDTVVFDERLAGGWIQENENTLWKFTRTDDDSYELVIREDDKSGEFDVHLVNLDGQLYMDLFPGDLDCGEMVDFYKIHILPAHTFMKVTFEGTEVHLHIINPSTLEKILERNPAPLKYERLEEAKNIVMTASTEELQKFMIKYSGENDFFGDPMKLKKGPFFSTKDVIFEPALVGKWSNENGTMVLSAVDDKYYKIEHTSKDDKKEYSAVLVKTKGQMFWALFIGNIDKDILLQSSIWPDMVIGIENVTPNLQMRMLEYKQAERIMNLKGKAFDDAMMEMELVEMNSVK